MYLTYEEYSDMGGTLDDTAFEQLEFEARAIVDWWTFNRLHRETSYPEALKRCMFKLMSLLQDKQRATAVDPSTNTIGVKPGIASESNDGVSVSYNTLSAKEAVDTIQKEIDQTIQTYLLGIRNSLGHNLLYRGIYPNE